ncbi:sialate O-acetylesterase [Luteolibacter sp. GHJ8]|uniref:Sialate O-acetylesterase n=1 Tax=Luteolibacter rhizosphaerae TaxID=2989719 RepID=A0ABT3G185_9BACT|nr:sialate O-acetylesterase [Luteolibacter rhizosphaerae]MCW1913344.1 sialate O-acetylesterase [Luteolibacter rhizosphaerae]
MSRFTRLRRQWSRPALDGPWTLPVDPARLQVFLLMGQSNMAGYGCIRTEDPWQPGDRDPLSGVLSLGGQCTLKSGLARGWTRWRPASHPLHLNQASAAFGLALPFAARLRKQAPDAMIGFVPCAWGGAPIDALGPGSLLYANALGRARIAARSGTLAGVLWHQGETDADHESLAPLHAAKLEALILQLRRDLGTSTLPFLIGDLGGWGDDQRKPASVDRRNIVRSGLRRVATEDSHAAFVESTGLPGVDSVHFGRSALIEFGHRYAAAYLALISGAARNEP